MLIWRAGAAPPPGGGNATSVSAAIRFQFVTSLGCAAAEATCTPTVAIGARAASTPRAAIAASAAADTGRLRVFIDVALVARGARPWSFAPNARPHGETQSI